MRGVFVPVALAIGAALLAAILPGGLRADADGTAESAAAQAPHDPLPARQPFPPPLMTLVGGHLTEGDARNPAIYPPEHVGMFFNHHAHVVDIDIPCADCHVDAPKSRSAKDDLIPGKAVCLECHDPLEVPHEWGPDAGAKSALKLPPAHLRFSHREHVQEAGLKCLDCHTNVDQIKVATREHLPSMETCVKCHAEKGVTTDCAACHLPGRSGTIRTSFGSFKLVPDDHGLDYLKRHGLDAERDPGQCAACHVQEDCLSCHDGAIPPEFHEPNYLLLHPQEAMANSPPCASCHRVDRFCRDCHFKAGVTMGSPLFSFSTGRFHPESWMDPAAAGDFHGHAARRSLQECASCHSKVDCTGCHAFAAGAPRIHPPGFAASRRARELRAANPGLCLECHGFGDPADPIQP